MPSTWFREAALIWELRECQYIGEPYRLQPTFTRSGNYSLENWYANSTALPAATDTI